MWGNLDLNQRPAGYESAALTTELLPRMKWVIYLIALIVENQVELLCGNARKNFSEILIAYPYYHFVLFLEEIKIQNR